MSWKIQKQVTEISTVTDPCTEEEHVNSVEVM